MRTERNYHDACSLTPEWRVASLIRRFSFACLQNKRESSLQQNFKRALSIGMFPSLTSMVFQRHWDKEGCINIALVESHKYVIMRFQKLKTLKSVIN